MLHLYVAGPGSSTYHLRSDAEGLLESLMELAVGRCGLGEAPWEELTRSWGYMVRSLGALLAAGRGSWKAGIRGWADLQLSILRLPRGCRPEGCYVGRLDHYAHPRQEEDGPSGATVYLWINVTRRMAYQGAVPTERKIRFYDRSLRGKLAGFRLPRSRLVVWYERQGEWALVEDSDRKRYLCSRDFCLEVMSSKVVDALMELGLDDCASYEEARWKLLLRSVES